MVTYKYYIFAIVLAFMFTTNASAQLAVVGHVSAEVVDGASISSNAITELSLNSIDSSQEIDLGKITVKTGSSSSCDVILKPATLTNSTGESLTLEATATNSAQLNVGPSNNNRTLALWGNTNRAKGETGTYQGSYTIVLAYN